MPGEVLDEGGLRLVHTIKHMYPQVGQSKYFCCLLIREVLTRKKKSVNFHTFGPPILEKNFFADLHDLEHERKKIKKV